MHKVLVRKKERCQKTTTKKLDSKKGPLYNLQRRQRVYIAPKPAEVAQW